MKKNNARAQNNMQRMVRTVSREKKKLNRFLPKKIVRALTCR